MAKGVQVNSYEARAEPSRSNVNGTGCPGKYNRTSEQEMTWVPSQSDARRRWGINRSFHNELDSEGNSREKKGIYLSRVTAAQTHGQEHECSKVQICLQHTGCPAQSLS